MADDDHAGGRHAARRAFHVAVSLSVLYYWFPDRLVEVGLTKEQLTVGGVAVMVALEAVRLRKGALVFPQREYERHRVGAHVWLVGGCALALLFFEQRFAMVTILGTTLVDPVVGELRLAGKARWALPVGLLGWAGVALALAWLVPLAFPLVLVPLGALAAVGAERVRIRALDDDFLMNVVPLVALTAAAGALAL